MGVRVHVTYVGVSPPCDPNDLTTDKVFATSHPKQDDDATSREVLYGYADLLIVGCRYYR